MNIVQKLKLLEVKNAGYKKYRYFDCDGDPYNCDTMLVGLNPALGLPDNKIFWDYWSDVSGFELKKWKEDYETERIKLNKPKTSPTRNRIEVLRTSIQPYKLLNCNIYSKDTPRLKDLKSNDREVEIFNILLSEIKPKIVILHGRLTKKIFEKIIPLYISKHPNWDIHEIQLCGNLVKIITIPHLFNMALTHGKNPTRNIELLTGLIKSA
jgi:hypothetical protein